jgi:hypothetical protein
MAQGDGVVHAAQRQPPIELSSRRMKRSPASERVQIEWLRRVEAEYRSAAITQHLTLWLIQIGASPDLIHDGLRIVKDELAHASLSHRTYVAAGGSGGPTLARESLALVHRDGEPLESDVLRVCVDVYCLGETVAVRLFKELRERCSVPIARRALDRVLDDEVRHRDFGWALLGWLLETPRADALRAIVRKELPASFRRIRAMYAPDDLHEEPLAPVDSTWGLMPAARYAAQLEKTFDRDYIPRFAKLGIDARAAART